MHAIKWVSCHKNDFLRQELEMFGQLPHWRLIKIEIQLNNVSSRNDANVKNSV